MSAFDIAKELDIRPRKPVVKIDDTVPIDFAGDPAISTFFVALSCLFPDGEKFFITSVRHYLDQIKDPLLLEQISGFIGQEGMHARQHIEFNRWLESRGYPIKKQLLRVKFGTSAMRRWLPKRLQLAITIAVEHFTASMASVTLNHGDEILAKWDPKARAVWEWHGIEEAEHKAVAYDVYMAIGGGYFLRSFSMFLGTLIFISQIVITQYSSLRATGNLKWQVIWQGSKTVWHKNGLFRLMFPLWLTYFKPGFHPWQEDNRAQIDAQSQRLVDFNYILPKTD